MKKIYILAMTLVAFGLLNAQVLIIDENFEDWDPTSADGFTSNAYTAWNYTTPSGAEFDVQNTRYNKVGDTYIDLERDNKSPVGAIILPEIPSCSKIEIDYRSGNNNSVTGDRYIYLSSYDGSDFTKVTPDYPAIGSTVFKNPDAPEFIDTNAKFQTVVITEEVQSSTPIRFAIQGAGNGNLRIENIRVWSDGSVSVFNIENSAVVCSQYYNLSGVSVGSDFNSLSNGVYIKVDTFENGSKSSSKVIKN